MDTADRTHSTFTAPAARAPRVALPTGTVLAGRFTLLAPAGQGGMGIVYRARDEHSGHVVALKLLHAASSPEALQRFGREAELLAALRHPAIVAHVAHGLTEQGHPFLAMQWLEGEDLARRLKREPLGLTAALALVRRAAEALAVAHQHGVVHRDLKPSNLFLRHGRPEDVVLLDFGLARHASGTRALTSSHAVLGTPGYMAPELVSAQGEPTLGADLFSLGCVLYECLSGQPPFGAPHFTAVLAKILFAEPAPLHSVRPELPEALQPLLDRLLAKGPQARLPHARALLEMLDALEGRPGTLGPQGGLGPPPASGTEQQLVSVLLATLPMPDEAGEAERERRGALRTRLREHLVASGAQVELLAEGSLVATLLPGRGTATDQAALAARCALYVQELWPESRVGLATGLGTLRHTLPVGRVMDKAGLLLRELEQLSTSARVLLDEVTAGLLGPSFQLTRPAPHLFLLHGEHLGVEASRRLLGRPAPCVGREQELATLELAYATCVEEPAAQALLVVAAAGMGKSRLLQELLRRLEQREHSPLLLSARGDPMSAGSACGLLGQALRRLCGVSEGEELAARREKLARRLGQHLPEEHARRTVEFLGELCHVPFPEEHSPRLRAARGDPKLMSTQVAQALVTFLRAECQHRPVLLVLEDMQWGDAFTVRLVDEALRELAEQPLLVLALARPELRPLFPHLWARCLQELPLRGLSRKACARLVREVLGEVPPATVERLCEQSGGNALFLEELIRQVAEGRGEAPPETVLAMLQARLLRLEPEARQVLLAASLFGRSFWARGVQALLPGQGPGEALAYWLQRLVELELVEPQSPSRLMSEAEYRFRQELVREAAYGLVPEAHKQQGHARAGAWLEQAGESEPRVLAEHALLAQQAERAIHFLTLAAERHLERNSVREALLCMQAALEMGPRGQALSRLRALQATAAFWQGDFSSSYELGREVLPELEPGSVPWCRLAAMLFLRHAVEGQVGPVVELGGRLVDTAPEAGALGEYVESLNLWCAVLTWFGARAEATAALARRATRVPPALAGDALVQAWSTYAQGLCGYLFLPRPWQSLVWAEQAMQCFREVGAERQALFARMTVALCREVLGDRAGAVEVLREGLVAARQTGQPVLLAYARFHLGLMLAGSSERAHQEEARAMALRFATAEALSPWAQGMVHAVLARGAALRGEWAEAEAQALRASEWLTPFTPYFLMMRTVLAMALLGQGRFAEAREVAALGVQALEDLESEGLHAVGLRLVLVEACFAQGDSRAAEPPLRRGLECLLERARDIPEGAARERFLQVYEHARVLALARQRWGEAVAV